MPLTAHITVGLDSFLSLMMLYVGKDICDPEGGCCKRAIDTLQMRQGKAYELARLAYEAICNDAKWTRNDVERPNVGLGTYVERRQAIWINTKDLQAARARMPTSLSRLPRLQSAYGVRFEPGLRPSIQLSQFMCHCRGCHDSPRSVCKFAKMCMPRATHIFRVDHVREATKKVLKAYLLLKAPTMPRGGNRPVLVTRVADCMTWDDGEREALDAAMLSQEVSKRLITFFTERQAQLEAKERAQDEAEGAQEPILLPPAEVKAVLAEQDRADRQFAGVINQTVVELDQSLAKEGLTDHERYCSLLHEDRLFRRECM